MTSPTFSYATGATNGYALRVGVTAWTTTNAACACEATAWTAKVSTLRSAQNSLLRQEDPNHQCLTPHRQPPPPPHRPPTLRDRRTYQCLGTLTLQSMGHQSSTPQSMGHQSINQSTFQSMGHQSVDLSIKGPQQISLSVLVVRGRFWEELQTVNRTSSKVGQLRIRSKA